MNQNDTTITIPAAIDVLPLPISEKIALARINENPLSRNADLAKSLGITERGVKKLLQRLRSAGYVEQARKGRARRLFLTFHVEQGTEFPQPKDSSKISIGELCSDLPQPAMPKQIATTTAQIPLDEFFEMTMRTIDEIIHQSAFFPFNRRAAASAAHQTGGS
jgi:predicted ArsR family transcriptional regulator